MADSQGRSWQYLCMGLLFPTTGLAASSFNLYAGITPSIIQNGLGLTTACLSALNSTVNCDSGTTRLAAESPDSSYWTSENVTTFCTSTCATSMSNWVNNVQRSCSGQTVSFGDTIVKAETDPLVISAGHDLVCLESGNTWCYLESQRWQGSDYVRFDPYMCDHEDPSQNPALCSEPGFSTDQILPDMTNVTRLYPRSLLCDDCFVKMWRQRLLSPTLPNSDHTKYLIEQYDQIQRNCSTTLPVTTYSGTLVSRPARPIVSATPTPTSSGSCNGQIINPPSNDMDYGCGQLAATYSVSTGELMRATGDYMCRFTAPICVHLPCELETIYGLETCSELAAKYSSAGKPVSLLQFQSWNRQIVGDCSSLRADQQICKGPPGGTFTANNTIIAPTGTGSYFTTATHAMPTQSGTTASCGRYYDVISGDTCNGISLVYGITFAILQKLNTYITDACSNLWISTSVCVAPVSEGPKSQDGTCGPDHGYAVCNGTSFGRCCSSAGQCGSGDECTYGNCISGECLPDQEEISQDGTCGPDHGDTTCLGSNFGDCCSIYGYCGSSSDFCGPGQCYSGKCALDNGGPSTDGSCGPNFTGNKTCTGTQFGNCCSTSGYCGSTADYCKGSNCYSGACN